jgi:hypothetical protein
MPNFDGNGPLKRERIIGQGRGSCKQTSPECPRKDTNPDTRHEDETSTQ